MIAPGARRGVRGRGPADPATRRDRAVELAGAELRRPFDLEHGPVFRATLFRAAADEHLLLLVMHHMVSDGWSCACSAASWARCTTRVRATAGRSPLPELPIQYADYAHWQRDAARRRRAERAARPLARRARRRRAACELPDRPAAPARGRLHGAGRVPRPRRRLTADRSRLARSGGVTLFMVLLAAFRVLLRPCSGQDDVAVGSPDRRPRPAGARAPARLLRQHPGAARRPVRGPGVPELLAAPAAARSARSATRTCRSSRSSRPCSPRATRRATRCSRCCSTRPDPTRRAGSSAGLDVELADLHNESGKVDLALVRDRPRRRHSSWRSSTPRDLFEPRHRRLVRRALRRGARPGRRRPGPRRCRTLDVLAGERARAVVRAGTRPDLDVSDRRRSTSCSRPGSRARPGRRRPSSPTTARRSPTPS